MHRIEMPVGMHTHTDTHTKHTHAHEHTLNSSVANTYTH
jgi:hypothetical protein